MVVTARGEDAWTRVKQAAGVEEQLFMTHHAYPDAMTIALLAATADELGTTMEQILERFGEHWVLVTAKDYGSLLDATGKDLWSSSGTSRTSTRASRSPIPTSTRPASAAPR